MRLGILAVVSFTPNGKWQAERIQKLLENPLDDCKWVVNCVHKPENLKDWCGQQFKKAEAILFIGAMGIAVRTIAPYIQNKTTDPAVLVMDEKGRHIISVLSGHLGGGNELTRALANALQADPVITTSSDVNGKIAIDVFAKKNQLHITSMKMAKKIAADIVADKSVSFYCEGRIRGTIPQELSSKRKTAVSHVCVTPYETSGENTLWLIPKAFILGIGCKKGKTLEEIEAAVSEVLAEKKIPLRSIAAAASIDLKAQEKGLLQFCRKYKIPVHFYSPETLLRAPGEYEASSFVKSVTGVDNVCERAAMCRAWEENPEIAKKESMVIEKTKKDGVTVALVKKDWSVKF